jgi:ubiquinone/menaquinone biosynthesis C-methylase UbiE
MESPSNQRPPSRPFLWRLQPEAMVGLAASFYDKFSGGRIFRKHYELVMQDILNYCPQGRLLDVGTGPGRLLTMINKAAPDLELVGLDASSAMVERARRHAADAGLSERIIFEVGYARRMPFPDSSFDAVVSTASIHHWKDPVAGLDEMHRVLKPGGYALLYDLVRRMPKEVWNAAKHEFGGFWVTLLWLHAFEEPFYTEEDLRSLASASPFGSSAAHFIGLFCCIAMQKPQ